MNRSPQAQRRPVLRGFTLTELLVVITILSMLAALLMPALKQARESAKAVFCMNNLRQCALAIQQYSNDQEGYTPPAYGTTTWTTGPWNVHLWLGGYAPKPRKGTGGTPPANVSTYYCPINAPTNERLNDQLGNYGCFCHSYGLRFTSTGINLLKLSSPASYPMLADSIAPAGGPTAFYLAGAQIFSFSTGGYGTAYLVHHGRANVAYADGSVRSVDGATLIADGIPGTQIWPP